MKQNRRGELLYYSSKYRFGHIFFCIDWGKEDRGKREKNLFPFARFSFVFLVFYVTINICLLVNLCGRSHPNNERRQQRKGRQQNLPEFRCLSLMGNPGSNFTAGELTSGGLGPNWVCAQRAFAAVIFDPPSLTGHPRSHLPVGPVEWASRDASLVPSPSFKVEAWCLMLPPLCLAWRWHVLSQCSWMLLSLSVAALLMFYFFFQTDASLSPSSLYPPLVQLFCFLSLLVSLSNS